MTKQLVGYDPAKEYLQSVRMARFEVQRCRRKMEELRNECESITAQMTGMPGGGGDLHKDGAWAALADQVSALSVLYKEALQQEQEVEAFINRLSSSQHRMVLKLRYLDLLSWSRVRDEMAKSGDSYELRHVYRIHGDALIAARIQLRKERGEEA